MLASHSPVFERLTRLLDPFNPAELHGLLCGLLCANPNLNCDQWLSHVHEELADAHEGSEPTDDLLRKLFEYGATQLNNADCAVTPLLPEDEAPLQQRSDALGAWCQGLLFGLGLGQADCHGALSAESREFLRDAAEIARVGFETEEATEADETAYAEVVEYLRVGLLIVQQDLNRPTARLH
ncbi:MAG: UPF0149 family protein [Candidatus Competibacter sp.]|nr:UPF0149 family protein [Candidatus Competibacter sp.]MDG4583464.1 UPF0149 family protein [Candidatus Competibacter sp.]